MVVVAVYNQQRNTLLNPRDDTPNAESPGKADAVEQRGETGIQPESIE
jgi:hypothetical protein